MSRTIFMIHGMWGGSWCWDNFKKYFEEMGYKCIVPILRYHNVSPLEKPDPRLGTVSLRDYADDLEKEIKNLSEEPIIMGHSMGGLLAQILASRGLGKMIVLLTPAPPAGINALKISVIRSFLSSFLKIGFWKRPMKQTFSEAVYSMMHLLPLEEQKKAYNKFVYESGRAACEIGFWFFDRHKSASVDESKIKCPMLVIAGKLDRITPASVVKKIAEKYKTVSTYKEFDNHTHWVIGEEKWEDVARYVSEWINKQI